MDIREIESFFSYKPLFDPNPQFLIDKIKKTASEYMSQEKIQNIQKAYEYALKAHWEWNRLSGEPYIVHPIRATEFLMELKPDSETIQACLLHDVIEDTPITFEDVKKEFGDEVANLCEWLVKVSTIKYKWEDRKLETIKKTFLAMAKDLRVIFIKLADRIHNIQTLHYHPKTEKQKKIATETMKIYVAVAKRLWLYQYQLYLENWCFKILQPSDFKRTINHIKKIFSDDAYVERWAKKLEKLLSKEWIQNFSVKWRLKSPYRVREKMEKKYQSHDFTNVMDMLAYRILTENITDAYLALGIIHKYYTPMIKKIKDYIAVPKFNGYKSLHTTVLGMFRFPIEVQIRTYEMEKIAEFGVAAHFAYSEKTGNMIPAQQSERIEKLQTLVNEYKESENKDSFKKELNIEMLNKAMFLYTPKGDVIELPQWWSVLDFAFHIHSDIWLHFKNALVNREIKPISYIPKTGDVVMIQTRKNKFTANKHRLNFLHTPSAKSHLSRFLKQQEKESILKKIIGDVNRRLREEWLPALRSQGDKIAKHYTQSTLEWKLLEINDKKYTIGKLIRDAYGSIPSEKAQTSNKEKTKKKITKIQTQVLIDGDKIMNYTFCPECKPQTEQRIIAKTGKDWIKIHTLKCRAIKTMSLLRLLEAHRANQDIGTYHFGVVLKIQNKYGNLIYIMEKLWELNMEISHVWVKNLNDGTSEVTIESEYQNPSQINFLIKDIKKRNHFVSITKQYIS